MLQLLCLGLIALTMPSEGLVEAKVVGISIAVAAILQVCKQAPVLQQWLTGYVAIIINIVLSIAGVYAVVQPADVFSLQTFVTVLTAALAAAGVHGTATKMAAYHKEAKMAKLAKIHDAEKAAYMGSQKPPVV